jgi:hypothetical protein
MNLLAVVRKSRKGKISVIKSKEKLLCAKKRVEKENHNVVPSCCAGFPLNTLFSRCSSTHTTKPVRMNAIPVVNQSSRLSGFKKIHMFSLSSRFVKTTIVMPDSEKGNVKSTYVERLAIIVISPTAASKFCKTINEDKLIFLLNFIFACRKKLKWHNTNL